MSEPTATPDGLLARFFDAFLQERNIKWLLGVGTAIVLGSTAMLVVQHWEETTPTWRHGVLLLSTVAVFGVGRFLYFRQGLRRSGMVVQGLTVFLIPMLCLALHWVVGAGGIDAYPSRGGVEGAVAIGLLGATALFAILASRAVFKVMLRGVPPTFWISYLTLCFAAFRSPLPDGRLKIATIFVLWIVFFLGVVKVNRHLFWLEEQGLRPRVPSLLPLVLLGGQFAALWVLWARPLLPLDWMGFGCALTGLPLLFTADTLARVHISRRGALASPWPFEVVALLGGALGLAALGVTLSIVGAGQALDALTPAALVATIMLALTGHRTRNSAFVWLGLFTLTMAYNSAGVLFKEPLVAVADAGAQQVLGEEYMPYAFYPLTYLPLILGFLWAARQRFVREHEAFRGPIRFAVIGLPLVMLAFATTHPKAHWSMGLLLTGVFTLIGARLRLRNLCYPALASFGLALHGLRYYAMNVWGFGLQPEAPFLLALVAALLLLLVERTWSERPRSLGEPLPFSSFVLAAVTLGWSLHGAVSLLGGLPAQLSLASAAALSIASAFVLVLVSGRIRKSWPLSLGLSGATLAVGLFLLERGFLLRDVVSTVAALAIGLRHLCGLGFWSRGTELVRFYSSAVGSWSSILIRPAVAFSTVALWTGLVGSPDPSLGPLWIPVQLLLVFQAFREARSLRSPFWGGMAFALSLGSLTVIATQVLGTSFQSLVESGWLLVLWGAASAPGMLLAARARRRLPEGEALAERLWWRPIEAASWGLALLSVGAGILWFEASAFTAGAIGLGLCLASGIISRQRMPRTFALDAAHLVLFALLARLLAPEANTWLELCRPEAAWVWPWMALGCAVSLLVVERERRALLGSHWPSVLKVLLAIALTLPLQDLQSVALIPIGLSFLIWAANETLLSIGRRNADRSLFAQGILVTGGLWFAGAGVLDLVWASMALPLCGAAACGLGRLLQRRDEFAKLAGDWESFGILVASFGVVLGIMAPASGAVLAEGIVSQGLFIAAFLYFLKWRMGRGAPAWLVASLVVLNSALMLLWTELEWSDPQLFMIPVGVSLIAIAHLLKAQLAQKVREGMSIAGALWILISPTFAILDGSWVNLFTLMASSVGVLFVGIGIRMRTLVYAGTAFLTADLLGMVVRGSIDDPNVLWVAGVALGVGVVTLGVLAERNRERVVSRLRALTAILDGWA